MPKKRKKGVADRNRKKIKSSKKKAKKAIPAKKAAIKEIIASNSLPSKKLNKNVKKGAERLISKKLNGNVRNKKGAERIISKKLATQKYKIKKGWFAERGEHALAAKGIGVRKKEVLKYKYLYSVFISISLLLAIASLIKEDLFSFIIGTSMMFLSLIFYMGAVEKDERRTILYISAWPFALSIAIASIFKKNLFSFILGILIMALSSFTLMIIKSKTRKESVIKIVRDLQKERKKTETDFDKLLTLLQELKRLKISEIAKAFNIEKKKANEWARIMEESNLAFLHYPAFGEEELRIKCK